MVSVSAVSRRGVLGAALWVAGAAPLLAREAALAFAFQPQKDPASIRKAADEVAAALAPRLKRRVDVVVPLAYAATVQALVSGRADVAWLSSLPFLLARRDGGARLLLAEVRRDTSGRARTDYDSLFVVRADSPLRDFADLRREARRLRMVFTSPTSTSGYVFPYARLVRERMLKPGQPPEQLFAGVSYGGGYTQALEQLLAGRGDVAAVSDYTVEGPKRGTYIDEARQKGLRVIARTPGVPTHPVAARGGMAAGLRREIRAALLELSAASPALLSDVYGASGLVAVDEAKHVAATVEAIRLTGLPIAGLVK
ncbi:phosphate/phosphite/phosphonate ABC transporter substrate-binding protein [Sandaracinobacteroides saxicola]|uniref:Phosphate/phosphite/phosphonate ABC transporter substrate-binding protein n=1 Tax=Sandaracinobacteroides saxicola TaxID=2759707 RepID=A0A7G5IL64_9SPHN|nr:phosphate/phosphite/phosphonate ABC transporter substrate-binding protein [Sandaracinobacteroides saxicola]QMW24106.1 phosphate/phosphite/phosphonate ABC transporter substrate-binding protein [Sandaracinobacteroides saxicola]